MSGVEGLARRVWISTGGRALEFWNMDTAHMGGGVGPVGVHVLQEIKVMKKKKKEG